MKQVDAISYNPMVKFVKSEYQWGVVGGLIFVVVFEFFGYLPIDKNLYFCRDDGVITMSHARNLVDYGFIGVNPSGDKVEAFSAPLQFVVFSIVYFFFRCGPATYTTIQTLLCTFLLGAVFIQFLEKSQMARILGCVVAALGLTRMYSFLEWHGSGMENAITNVSVLLLMYVFYDSERVGRIRRGLVLIVFMASISRSESIAYVLPGLVIFSIYWYIAHKNLGGIILLCEVLFMWAAFEGVRFLYFGNLISNTAFIQNISPRVLIKKVTTFDAHLITDNIEYSKMIFRSHGGYLLIASLPLWFLVKWDKKMAVILIVLGTILISSIANPIFFGPARIDVTRTTSHLAMVLVIALSYLISNIDYGRRRNALAVPSVLALLVYVLLRTTPGPYYLGWEITGFQNNRIEFERLAKANRILRPTVSNADLGIVSWSKTLNIIDLAGLGSPAVGHLESQDEIKDYFLEYAQPDLLELHGGWSLAYSDITNDSTFKALYERVVEWKDYQNDRQCPQGIWMRRNIMAKSQSREREFLDSLQQKPGDIDLGYIESEIQHAVSSHQGTTYIFRTLYRFVPELRQQDKIDALRALIQKYQLSDYAKYIANCSFDAESYNLVLREVSAEYIPLEEISKNVVQSVSEITLKGGTMFAHAPSLLYLDLSKYPIYGRLLRVSFGYTDPVNAAKGSDGVRFIAYYKGESNQEITLLDRRVLPTDSSAAKLSALIGIPSDRGVDKIFLRVDPLSNNAFDWSYWGGFKIEDPKGSMPSMH